MRPNPDRHPASALSPEGQSGRIGCRVLVGEKQASLR